MTRKWKKTYRTTILVFMTLVISIRCHPPPRDLTVVTGKTVYGELALEDVHIEIYKQEQSGWEYFSDSRSGYHGSFRFHLPPGTFLLQASTILKSGENEISLSGTLENLIVKLGERRMDQVVIRMEQNQ